MKIGVQLYTVRDETEKDFIGTLEKIAEMGYEGVEFAGYGDLPATELRGHLDRLGLQAAGSHVSLEAMLEDADGQVAAMKTLGGTYLIIPFVDESKREDEAAWIEVFEQLGRISEKCQEAGLQFCYHNHDFELTSHVQGMPALDAMAKHLSSQQLKLELDVCWIQHAGLSPVSYIQQYRQRVPLIHYKDLALAEDGTPLTVELGKGQLPLQAIAAAADQNGVEWLIVEQDECQIGSLDSIRNNRQWIRQHLSL
ncbi:sugar phosphate isomerase/epimerase family protein [Marinicrinis sediminis]|uniref:Sugar phosphate isomerase/epimerase family protein n=1 Tax=Marinicrinis sediminis TaxID=1652465 RepID=A0ABW5R5U0_9BACL